MAVVSIANDPFQAIFFIFLSINWSCNWNIYAKKNEVTIFESRIIRIRMDFILSLNNITKPTGIIVNIQYDLFRVCVILSDYIFLFSSNDYSKAREFTIDLTKKIYLFAYTTS